MKNTWDDWHKKSQQAIVDGNLSLALDCEIAAINALDPTTQQRTLGITVVLACAIACRAKDFERLNKIADQWFGEIPEYFQGKVESILTDATGTVPGSIKMLAKRGSRIRSMKFWTSLIPQILITWQQTGPISVAPKS